MRTIVEVRRSHDRPALLLMPRRRGLPLLMGVQHPVMLRAAPPDRARMRTSLRVARRARARRRAAGAGPARLQFVSRALGRRHRCAAACCRPEHLEDMKQTLAASGFTGSNAVGLFVGAKIAAAGRLAAVGLHDRSPASCSMTFLRNAIVVRRGHCRAAAAGHVRAASCASAICRQLERGLPDALDLMVICAEAGLSLEPTIDRVGRRDPARRIAPIGIGTAADRAAKCR